MTFFKEQFDRPVTLSGAIFIKNASFMQVIFKDNINFSNVFFGCIADFCLSEFQGTANFRNSKFQDTANFKGTIFKDIANFKETIFKELLNISNLTFNEGAKLNLMNTQVDSIDFTESKIEVDNAENRETFLVLKNIASRQNDNISALDFHTKEYEKYYKSIDWLSKDLGNKGILFFEKWVSHFGTKVWKGIVAFILFDLIFYLWEDFFCYVLGDTYLYLLEYLSFTRFLDSFIQSIHPVVSKGDIGIVDFFQLIINSFIVYEIIKSFRKFSRKF